MKKKSAKAKKTAAKQSKDNKPKNKKANDNKPNAKKTKEERSKLKTKASKASKRKKPEPKESHPGAMSPTAVMGPGHLENASRVLSRPHNVRSRKRALVLLNLPLREAVKGVWRDESVFEHDAKQNKKCQVTSNEKLGSCLLLQSGAQLTLTGEPDQFERAATEGKQLTVEFWAVPANETDEPRQIVGGPLNISLGRRKVFWAFGDAGGSVELSQDLQTDDGEPHHWAIVIDRDRDPVFEVYRDGVGIDGIVAEAKVSAAVATKTQGQLVIGSKNASQGWTGQLAHLRVWAAALDPERLRKSMQRDMTTRAAFRASTGIDWQLLNADDEPSLYIRGSREQVLRVVVENGFGTKLTISATESTESESPSTTEPSLRNYHCMLAFRPGTLEKSVLKNKSLARIRAANPGWKIGTGQLQELEEQDCLFFLWNESSGLTLEPGQAFEIKLPGVAAATGSGSRTTRVLWKYQNFKLGAGSIEAETLDGHRAQVLNIIYRDPTTATGVPYRKPPLEVGVVGAPGVLNNGTETCLTLYIKNLHRDEDGRAAALALGPTSTPEDMKPKFILEIDTLTEAVETQGSRLENGDKYVLSNQVFEFKSGDTAPKANVLVFGKGPIDAKGLGDFDDLMGIVVKTVPDQSSTMRPHGGVAGNSTVRWEIDPVQTVDPQHYGFAPNEAVMLTLAGLKTSAPPGRSILRLRYEDIDEYGEGLFEIPIDRVPAVPAALTNGGPGYGLAVGYDPRDVADPNGPVLNEVLSVNQVGTGLAARFSGGSGVEVDCKLVAKQDVEIKRKLNANDGVDILGKLDVKDEASIGGKLVAIKDAEVGGKLVASTDAEVGGTLVAKKGVQINGELDANSKTKVRDLVVTYGAELQGELTVFGGAEVRRRLIVKNLTEERGDLLSVVKTGAGCSARFRGGQGVDVDSLTAINTNTSRLWAREKATLMGLVLGIGGTPMVGIVAGSVDKDGNAVAGEGFTSKKSTDGRGRPVTGVYLLEFTTLTNPVILVTCYDHEQDNLANVTPGRVTTVRISDASPDKNSKSEDAAFGFIAIDVGP